MKNFKTIDEQIEILRTRGLNVSNVEKLKKYLSNYNYYRLSGYSLKYRDNDIFKSYVYDEHIYQSFEIDNEMRLILLELCFVVESKIKSKIAYVLGQEDPLCYLKNDIYNEFNIFDSNKNLYKKDSIFESAFDYIKNNNAKIYEHHRDKYNEQYPIWVIMDFLSFGETVKLYNILKNEYKIKISNNFTKYSISYKDLEKYLKSINCLRNACAHGDRLINKGLSRKLPLSCLDKNKFSYLKNDFLLKKSDKVLSNVYGYLISIVQLLVDEQDILNSFYIKITNLFEKYYLIKPDYYGFVGEWNINIKMPNNMYLRIKSVKHIYSNN